MYWRLSSLDLAKSINSGDNCVSFAGLYQLRNRLCGIGTILGKCPAISALEIPCIKGYIVVTYTSATEEWGEQMAESETFNVDNWAAQIRRGLLELCVLNIVAQGEVYGYDLVQRLTALGGLSISGGSVYPLLSRMRKAGLLRARLEESPNGPARKYYGLTEEGVKCRDMMNRHWDELARGIHSLQEGVEASDEH